MKVLLATDCYVFQLGGIYNLILSLESGLREKGCEVKVLTLSNTHNSFRDGDTYYIRSIRSFDYPDHRVSFARRDPLLDELIAWRPDIIHIHTEASACRMAKAIARKAGCPFVMTTHTYFEYFIFGRFRAFPLVNAAARLWGWLTYRGAERVMVPAEKATAFPHVQPAADRLRVEPNGIQLERYQKTVSADEKAELFRRHGLSAGRFTLITASRLSREKNMIELLRYMPALRKALPDVQLVIVGEGPERERLEAFSAENGLAANVIFTGRVAPDDMYKYYQMSDAYVSASTFELHSMSYLEALACGLPLVCREDMSLKGVLDDGVDGCIFTDEAQFTAGIARLATDKALYAQMRSNALARADVFSTQRFVERMLALYNSVLS